jgi:hypothetical protein
MNPTFPPRASHRERALAAYARGSAAGNDRQRAHRSNFVGPSFWLAMDLMPTPALILLACVVAVATVAIAALL